MNHIAGALNISCTGGASREPEGCSIRFRDVPERRLAEDVPSKNEERYRQLLDAIPTYTYSVDLQDGRATGTTHSPGCCAVTGYTPREYNADPEFWMRMVHPEDRAKVVDHVRRVSAYDRVKPIEHRIFHKNGTVRWVRNTVVHHRDTVGTVTGYSGLVEDITERKEAELALQKIRDELEECIQRRTIELARANERLHGEIDEHDRTEERLKDAIRQLNELDQARLQFVSNLSHDLKTPLASLHFAVDNMLTGIGGGVSDAHRSYLAMMKHDVERLIRTARSVLDMSRIEAHALSLSPSRVPVNDLVRRTVEAMKIHAVAKQQHLELALDDCGETVEWDADKIGQVVTNVVGNAIKYTNPGGVIRVSLDHDRAYPGGIVLSVIDNGIGIAQEYINRVGERYFRVGEQVDGAGIGLAIAKEIVHLHGGWIKFESPPHGATCGTRVLLYLPFSPPAGLPRTPAPSAGA